MRIGIYQKIRQFVKQFCLPFVWRKGQFIENICAQKLSKHVKKTEQACY